MNSKVNRFFVEVKKWSKELEVLRSILLDYAFEEEMKWNSPCYTRNGKNVIIIQGFKEYFAIMFFKGALLKDGNHQLRQPGEVQAGRQFRLKNMEELVEKEQIIRHFIQEAIVIEESGAKVDMKKPNDFEMPEELLTYFEQNPTVGEAFYQLTPGRQKAYAVFVAGAKQYQTKLDRIEKNVSRILKKKGLNDCICGLSKRMPNCDGSHKHL
jgi:uncharacterized protein YdeI (YjbR/CyaY-like superfamily)